MTTKKGVIFRKSINLMQFNGHMTTSLRQNDVIIEHWTFPDEARFAQLKFLKTLLYML